MATGSRFPASTAITDNASGRIWCTLSAVASPSAMMTVCGVSQTFTAVCAFFAESGSRRFPRVVMVCAAVIAPIHPPAAAAANHPTATGEHESSHPLAHRVRRFARCGLLAERLIATGKGVAALPRQPLRLAGALLALLVFGVELFASLLGRDRVGIRCPVINIQHVRYQLCGVGGLQRCTFQRGLSHHPRRTGCI